MYDSGAGDPLPVAGTAMRRATYTVQYVNGQMMPSVYYDQPP